MLLEFAAFARSVREGLLLLSGKGRILEANAAAVRALSLSEAALRDRDLSELCALSSDDCLRIWARTTSPVVGALSLREPPHTRFRCEGSAVAGTGEPLILLRFWSVDPSDRFLLLGRKIEELNAEMLRRQSAQRALRESEASLRQAVESLRRLHAISRQIAQLRTAGEVAEAVMREAVRHTGALRATAWLPSEDGAALEPLRHSDSGGCFSDEGPLPLDPALPAARAFRSGKSLFLHGAANEAPGRESIAALPLLLEGRATGVLGLSFAAEKAFEAQEREFLESLAQTLAHSLDRARLLESEQRSRRAAEQHAERTRRMLSVTAALAQALSPSEVAAAVMDEVVQATGAVRGGLWLLDAAGAALELARSVGFGEGASKYARIDLEGGALLPLLFAARRCEALFIESDEELSRWPEIAVPSMSVEQHGPLAVVPLVVQGRSTGALSYRFAPGSGIDADQRAMLLLIARAAAQALERTRLYESERRARREAQASEARAVEADRRKDEFLAMLGHELRNPLAPILTALQLMRLRDASAHERERTLIERQVHHLVTLVDDLLDVSRITRGLVQLQARPLEVAGIIATAVEMASPLFEARAQRLDVCVPAEPLWVQADAARLAQALSNVLNNAAKYTPPGGAISVQATRKGAEVVIGIRDTGIGIAPHILPRIFDLFVQEGRSLDRSQGGLGLGLTIVRSLVELHGGKVAAASDGVGRGSEFEIRLPAVEAPQAANTDGAPGRRAPQRDSAARVLIVDDNADAASVLAEALHEVGYSTTVAHDGPSGLAAARTFRPSVALLDIGLPVMDGYELAARMRAEAAAGTLALVAVTGYGQAADKARAISAGFDEHLVKPVDLDRVLDVLGRLTGATRAAS